LAPPPSRRRIAIELTLLFAATALFLAVAPHGTTLFVALAAGAFVVVIACARAIRSAWGAPAAAASLRWRRAVCYAAWTTVPPVLAFAATALYQHRPLFTAALGRAFATYVPWAIVQQTLFQLYLHGRLRILVRGAPLAPCLLTGICYGLVHLPNVTLTALTSCAGLMWSHSYQRDRLLLPIALSHAILGSTFYAWVEGHAALSTLFGHGG
jgi:hypothetical protein